MITHEGFEIHELPLLKPGEALMHRGNRIYVAEDVMVEAKVKQGGKWQKLDALAKDKKGKPLEGKRKVKL